VLGQATSHS